jgi:hypothetical protein
MLFDDEFAYGRWGNDGLGSLEDLLGGPSRYDAGEIVIVGRVPGALYVGDFSEYELGLEHIQPLEAAQGAFNTITVDLAEVGEHADLVLVEPPATPEDDSEEGAAAPAVTVEDEAPAALTRAVSEKTEEPLVLITQDDGEPLADAFGDIDPTDFGRPVVELTPIQPVITITAPDMTGGEQPAPVVTGGRAYQSLAFLLIDTPFVVGDDNLPPTVRPPLNALLGLPDEDDIGQTWVLPVTGRGAWILR